jgi:hypothetical protein
MIRFTIAWKLGKLSKTKVYGGAWMMGLSYSTIFYFFDVKMCLEKTEISIDTESILGLHIVRS